MFNMHTRWFKPHGHSAQNAAGTMVVVADAGRARVFSVMPQDGALEELDELVSPHLQADPSHGRADHPTHAAERHHDSEEFADAVCEYLSFAREAGKVDKLYMAAAPAFLGTLRHRMDPATRALIARELASDLIHHPVMDIRAALTPARP